MEKKKDKEIYSYMLRFNKELERDRQALDKITQFCRVTDMTMRDAILLILATVDVSALHKNILSLTVATGKNQAKEKKDEKKADKKRDIEAGVQNLPVSFGRDLEKENRSAYGEEQKKKATQKSQEEIKEQQEPVMDSMFEDIFNNF